MRRVAGAVVAAAAVAALGMLQTHDGVDLRPHPPAAAEPGPAVAVGTGSPSCPPGDPTPSLPAGTVLDLARRWVAALWAAEPTGPHRWPAALAGSTDPALLARLATARPVLGGGARPGPVEVVGAYPDAVDPAVVTVAVVEHDRRPSGPAVAAPGVTTVVVCADPAGRPRITDLR